MFWCLVRHSTGALSGGLYANPLEMAIQSAVACSEAKDGGLLVLRTPSAASTPTHQHQHQHHVGFDSHFRHRPFSKLSHASDLNIVSPVATLPGAWLYRVSVLTGWPIASTL